MQDNKNTSSLDVGRVVQDTYEIIERLGEGGMGATYKARHIDLGHLVCIKVISEAYSRDPKALDLFRREANLLREVGLISGSDAIVKIETLLRDSSGSYFLIMEFIDGQSLSHYINLGARLRDDDLIALAKRLLQGLAAIHSKNIVHRDISPDNIMVPQNNILMAKIVDFGLASDVAGTEKSILGDSFAGKISYASPEQLGLFGGKISARSDLYSLGLVLLVVAGLPLPPRGSMLEAVDSRRADIRISDPRLSPQTAVKIEALLRANPSDREDLFTVDNRARLPLRDAQPARAGDNVKYLKKLETFSVIVLAAVAVYFFGAGLSLQMARPQNTSIAERTPADTYSAPTAEPTEKANPFDFGAGFGAGTTAAQPSPEKMPENPMVQPPELDTKTLVVPPPNDDIATNPPDPAPEPPQPPTNEISITAAQALIADGSDTAIISAAKILGEISLDPTQSNRDRATAYALTGWIYDSYYRPALISAINAPDVNTALSSYEAARDLGLFAVQPEINRLSAIRQE